jgi:hypothetical protein
VKNEFEGICKEAAMVYFKTKSPHLPIEPKENKEGLPSG